MRSRRSVDARRILLWPAIAIVLIFVILIAEHAGRHENIAVVPTDITLPGEIRVIIMNDAQDSIYQKRVTLMSEDCDLEVHAGQDSFVVKKGEKYLFDSETTSLSGDIITVTAAEENALIQVTDLKRDGGIPAYPGSFEIERKDDGFVLVNIVAFEDYIARVVPSEMPAKYEKEALKAQAVCARTYAVMQIAQNSYQKYDADVDDSINFQVYNNKGTTDRTEKAAKDTAGQIILHEGEIAEALYFSTSCGYTTDGTLWGAKPEEVPHLKGRYLSRKETSEVQTGGKSKTSPEAMQEDENFYEFIRKSSQSDCYEDANAFFRWTAEVPEKKLRLPESIGNLQGIFVTERGRGGNVQKLVLVGSKGNHSIRGQAQIKGFLGRAIDGFHLKDGSTTQMGGSMPSGFFAIDETGRAEDGSKIFTVWGGGYGHGVGLSQNGANAMAESGLDYKEILTRFYTDIEIAEARK